MKQWMERCYLGYYNQKNQEVLRNDLLLCFDSNPASQLTISRFFGRVTVKSNRKFKSIMQKQACNFISKPTADIILDADLTLVITNGRQEASSYITHDNEMGYHSIVINEFHTNLLLSARIRAGNSYSSNGIIEELQEIFAYISGKDRRTIPFRGR